MPAAVNIRGNSQLIWGTLEQSIVAVSLYRCIARASSPARKGSGPGLGCRQRKPRRFKERAGTAPCVQPASPLLLFRRGIASFARSASSWQRALLLPMTCLSRGLSMSNAMPNFVNCIGEPVRATVQFPPFPRAAGERSSGSSRSQPGRAGCRARQRVTWFRQRRVLDGTLGVVQHAAQPALLLQLLGAASRPAPLHVDYGGHSPGTHAGPMAGQQHADARGLAWRARVAAQCGRSSAGAQCAGGRAGRSSSRDRNAAAGDCHWLRAVATTPPRDFRPPDWTHLSARRSEPMAARTPPPSCTPPKAARAHQRWHGAAIEIGQVLPAHGPGWCVVRSSR